MSISELSVKRPVAMTMVVLMVVVIGLYSLTMLPMDMTPEMNMPMVLISTTYSGVAPTEIESMVTENIEAAVASVSGIENITSTSSQGMSMVIAEFSYGADIDVCATEVREKIDLYRGMLPEDASDPLIMKLDPSMMPVANFSISVKGKDLVDTKTFAQNEVADVLEGVEGVASVSLAGGLEREIQVEIDPARMMGYSLSFDAITGSLLGDNMNLPGGETNSGGKTISLRSIAEFTGMEDIRTMPLILPNGQTIFLRDVAEVKDTYKEQSSYSRLNNEECISLSVQKQSGANTVEVMNRVNDKLEQIRSANPDAEIVMVFDQSDIIKEMISTVAQNALMGGLLTMLILLLFLQDVRATLVLAVSMPTSIIATFAAMYFSGVTLNIVSLGGLSLGVGMLVDNSIVVLENIYKFKANGQSAREAAIKGAKDVTGAVIASTLTTVIVFLPVIFTEGLTTMLFKEMALTVAFSQLCSLAITLMVVPMFASKLLAHEELRGVSAEQGRFSKIFVPFNRILESLHQGYERLLRYALGHRRKIACIAVVLLVGSLLLIPGIGMEFMPSMDSGTFTVNVELPKGTSLENTDDVVRKIESIATNYDEIEYLSSTVGSSGVLGTSSGGDTASVMITLKSGEKTDPVMERMREELNRSIAGANITLSASGGMSMSSGSPVNVKITGNDYDTAASIANQIVLEMANIEGIRDAASSVEDTKPELRIYLRREQAARYGLNVAGAANAIRGAVSGQVAGQYTEDGEEYDITVKFPDGYTETLDNIKNIKLPTAQGGTITIGEIADISMDKGAVSLTRENQKRVVTVSAGLHGRDLASVTGELQTMVENMNLPDGYSVTFGGDYADMTESFAGLGAAMLLAVVLIYMVMAMQFESLLHPFIIMFSIPFAFVGVFLSLFLSRTSLDVTAMIGVIMLAGIVVNNAIVLIDYVNQRRATYDGDLKELLVEAGKSRLRPILMTTLTSILGYIPTILSGSMGAVMMKGIAWVLMGGLSFSTVLTLVFIPVVYSVAEERKERRRGRKKRVQETVVVGDSRTDLIDM